MITISTLAAYGFLIGLKYAAPYPVNYITKFIAQVVCLILFAISIAQFSQHKDDMFVLVGALVLTAAIASAWATFTGIIWIEAVSATCYFAAYLLAGEPLYAFLTGISAGIYAFPLVSRYLHTGKWLKKGWVKYAKVSVIFGLVVAWIFAGKSLLFNVYDLLRWINTTI